MEEQFDDEGMRRVQWAKRKEKLQREKQKQMIFRKVSKIVVTVLIILIVALIIRGIKSNGKSPEDGKAPASNQGSAAVAELGNIDAGDGRTKNIERSQTDDTDGSAEGMTSGAEGIAGGAAGCEDGVPVSDVQDSGNMGREDGNGQEVFGSDTKGKKIEAGTSAAARPSGKYETTGKTMSPGEEVGSSYVIFVDMDEGNILMRRNETSRINPASMTKVLTLLVAAEHIDNLEDTFTITSDITDYCYVNDCSNAGFEKGDTMTIRDLLYGTILPSGADAALGLATYVAGSQEAFVELMNEKLEELGLAGSTHVTNCVGLYDENHYCTVYDMAVIMENAMNNELCPEVMSAHTYETSPTKRHPEGIILSNWFLRRIEDKDTGGEVVCGKTGYVVQSGNCAASYGVDHKGKRYICVTADASSVWSCIYDHVKMYKKYMG